MLLLHNLKSSILVKVQEFACRRPIEPPGLTKCLDAFSFFQAVLYQSLKA
jgi:hypothetical protein